MIPLFKVYMNPKASKMIDEVLYSGYVGEGPQCKKYEAAFANLIGNPNTVIVNSGTSALMMALKLADVGPGDKVVSTPMTCLATNMAIMAVGATPVWADILRDGTIDPEDVEKKAKGCKAIMCVDWGGLPCKLTELGEPGLFVIEDACQSLGAKYDGHSIGHDAEYVAFSTQAIKILTTVDGGALAINTDQTETARTMRWFGLDRTRGADMRCNQDPLVCGYKWQLNDVLATIGLANMEGLDERIKLTQRHAAIYNDFLGIKTDPERKSSYWLYTIYVDDVPEFIGYMKRHGVECSKVHDRNDTKTVFAPFRCDLPGVDWFDKHHVCIPVGWWLRDEDVGKILALLWGCHSRIIDML